MDRNDDLLIAEQMGGALLRVSAATGLLRSIIQQSSNGMPSGDGGPVSQAAAALIEGVMFDAASNLYFSDQGAIRQIIASTGIVRTIAGKADARGVSPSGDGGRALNAIFFSPSALAMDSSGTIYVMENDRIRRLTCQRAS